MTVDAAAGRAVPSESIVEAKTVPHASACWSRWSGSANLVAHLARAGASLLRQRAHQDPVCEIAVEVPLRHKRGDVDCETFASPDEFLIRVTPEALRKFSRLEVKLAAADNRIRLTVERGGILTAPALGQTVLLEVDVPDGSDAVSIRDRLRPLVDRGRPRLAWRKPHSHDGRPQTPPPALVGAGRQRGEIDVLLLAGAVSALVIFLLYKQLLVAAYDLPLIRDVYWLMLGGWAIFLMTLLLARLRSRFLRRLLPPVQVWTGRAPGNVLTSMWASGLPLFVELSVTGLVPHV